MQISPICFIFENGQKILSHKLAELSGFDFRSFYFFKSSKENDVVVFLTVAFVNISIWN